MINATKGKSNRMVFFKKPFLLTQEAANIFSLVVSLAKGIMSLVNNLDGEME